MLSLENQIQYLQAEIEKLKNRNKKVEWDKAWETSVFRKILILIITYILACLVMYSLGDHMRFYLNALIPTLWFFLSTLSFTFLKKYWIEKWYGKR